MIPLVWLFGASGVGKSTTGYGLLAALEALGVTAAYVDADQLRNAAGVAAGDDALIAAALPGLARSFAAGGAGVLVVSGIVDDAAHLERLLPGVARDAVFAVQLHAGADTLRERIARRGWLVELTDQAIADGERIPQELADLRVATDGRAPAALAQELAGAVVARLRQDPPAAWGPGEPATETRPERLVVITGPGGSGISTVGFQTFLALAYGDGEPAGYVDLHQMGFLGSRPRPQELAALRAANGLHVAACLAAGGARTVILSGDPRTTELVDDAHRFWLHADPEALAERLTASSRGEGTPLMGSPRLGLGEEELAEAIAAEVEASRAVPADHAVIDTTRRDPGDVARAILDDLVERQPARSTSAMRSSASGTSA